MPPFLRELLANRRPRVSSNSKSQEPATPSSELSIDYPEREDAQVLFHFGCFCLFMLFFILHLDWPVLCVWLFYLVCTCACYACVALLIHKAIGVHVSTNNNFLLNLIHACRCWRRVISRRRLSLVDPLQRRGPLDRDASDWPRNLWSTFSCSVKWVGTWNINFA